MFVVCIIVNIYNYLGKEIMSTHKKNNDWILCPSKSFPGKLYYFNVVSGETAWRISDTENKDLPKDVTSSKNINNFECCPEQFSPSAHISPNMRSFCDVHNNVQKSCNQFVPQMQGLDQTIYHNYLTNTNQYVPNIIWMPINLPPHVPKPKELNKQLFYHSCSKKEMEEKSVQTSDLNLTDQVVNSEVVWKCYRDNNNIIEINNLCRNYDKLKVTQDRMPRRYKEETLLKKPSLKLPTGFLSRNCSTSYNSNNNNMGKETSFETDVKFYNNVNVLDKSDLRLLLETKKKHLKVRGLEGGDANYNYKKSNHLSSTKKHVTFGHISQIEENNIDNYENFKKKMDPPSESLNICTFLNLKKFTVSPGGEWFIVVDLSVLIGDFKYIINIVRRDETCRLMIVYAVLSKIWELSRLENKSFAFVGVARRLIRQISNLTQHIIIFEEDRLDDIPISKQILNCCKKLVEKKYRLVMITDGADLYAKGKSLNLDCYMLEEIKGDIANNYLHTSKNIDILNNNKIKENNNLFLQNLGTLKTFKFGEKEEADQYSNKIIDNHQNSFKSHDFKLIRKTVYNNKAIVQNEFDNNMRGDLHSCFGNTEDIFPRYGEPEILAEFKKTSEENIIKLENLNEKLKKFYLKNKMMEDRIALRIEEFICTFTQIMETFMSDLLQKESSNSIYPCTIFEAADGIAELFHDYTSIQIIAYGMSALYNLINRNDKLGSNIDPNDVIKTIGCGQLLVEHIKIIKPDSERLAETESLLRHLICRIEDPVPDQNELMSTVEESRRENTVNSEREGSVNAYKISKLGFTNKHVLKYLQKHYPEWKDYCEEQEVEDKNEELIVYRTTGLNVNLLKITNSKKIVLDDKATVVDNFKNMRKEIESDCNKPVDLNNAYLKEGQTEIKTSSNNYVQQKDSLKTHENTFTTKQHEGNGPKVVRKCGIIEAFENKILKKLSDEASFKCKDNVIIRSENKTTTTKGKDEKLKTIVDEISETFSDSAHQMDVTNKGPSSHQSNDDSGLGRDYCNKQAFVKSFLIHLSSSLNIIYNFLNDSVLKLGKGNIEEDNKKEIFSKTDKTYKEVTVVIEKLKGIIKREQGEGTNIKLLLGDANEADDKRISRYKQVVTKCLEQAKLLHKGLKVLLCITNENCDTSLISEPDESNTGYYNLFE